MYQHILIPTDGSEIAAKAVAEGVELARSVGARVTFLTVSEPFPVMGDRQHAFSGMPESMRKQALEYLDAEARHAIDSATRLAADRGVNADTMTIEAGEVYETIIEAATSKAADLVVMGTHGRRGVKAMLLGSVAQKVLTHSKVPVLVVR